MTRVEYPSDIHIKLTKLLNQVWMPTRRKRTYNLEMWGGKEKEKVTLLCYGKCYWPTYARDNFRIHVERILKDSIPFKDYTCSIICLKEYNYTAFWYYYFFNMIKAVENAGGMKMFVTRTSTVVKGKWRPGFKYTILWESHTKMMF